jgi:ATP phosphoribosyltransferase
MNRNGMEHLSSQENQLIIGVPSKGRLKTHVIEFLGTCGFTVPEDVGRQLQTVIAEDERFHVVFLHPRDIPLMVEQGRIDVGFTGLDLIQEMKADVRPVVKIGRGMVRMALAAPIDTDVTHPFHLMHKTVGTPFPNMAREYFDRLKIEVDVVHIQGASEGLPYLGVVDAIFDVVETGASLRENHLEIIDDDIYFSECVALVNKPEFQSNWKLINHFLRSIYSYATN